MTTNAKAPFNNPAASMVLRTCDKHDFHVFKEILIVASPVFETTLSLPLPSSINNEQDFKGGVPVVMIEEYEECLDYILRLCYPLPAPPPLLSVSVAERVLKAATKYEIEKVIQLVQSELISLGSSNPFRLYTFSCELGYEGGAVYAARLMHQKYQYSEQERISFLFQVGVLPSSIRATGYFAINESYFCRLTSKLVVNPTTISLSPGCLVRLVRFICLGSYDAFCSPSHPFNSTSSSKPSLFFSSRDYTDLSVFNLYPHDATIRSSDEVDFRVHRLILHISQASDIGDEDSKLGGVPVLSVQENSSITRQLLYICYNLGDIAVDAFSSEEGIRIWSLAAKLGMEKIANKIKTNLFACTNANPLLAYFIAASCGWKKETENAARLFALKGDPLTEGYIEEMDSFATLSAYIALIQYYHRTAMAQYKLVSDMSSDLPPASLSI